MCLGDQSEFRPEGENYGAYSSHRRRRRKFDLAVLVRSRDDLPERSADDFVSALVGAAPVVLFSAAVQRQGGRNHLNEQVASYWQSVFSNHRLCRLRLRRPQIYHDRGFCLYRQNPLVYCRDDIIPKVIPL